MITGLKRRLLAIGAASIFALSGSTVLAGSYRLGVFTNSKGYEAGRETKNQATNTIKVQVTGSNWINLATNFLGCQAGSGVQMSDNLIIPHSDQTQHYLNYYPQYVNTTGVTIVLRVNSGQSQANYTVWGNWSAN